MKPLRVFIGYDPRQPLAYSVAAYSAVVNCSVPVSVTPLIQRQLPVKRKGLTEFTYTRYLPPYLCDYEGHALFMDGDVLVQGDLAELPWDHSAAVATVQHGQSALTGQKLAFERASVMLFNCEHAACYTLNPEYIEKEQPQTFEWANQFKAPAILPLDPAWNHLVGYDSPRKDAKIVHFTMGIPCFSETGNDEYAEIWRGYATQMQHTCSWEEIMGGSVHAQHKQPARELSMIGRLNRLPQTSGKR